MADLFALLKGPNRASSSSTPPPGQGPAVDPIPWVPPTQVPENIDAPAPPTLHTSMAQPFTSPFPPLPAPTAVPLPPAAFLTSDQVLSASPPVSMPTPAAAYTVPPPMADLSRKFIDQYQYCAEAPPTLLELSTKEMARGQRFEEYATKWRAQAAKHIPPISEAQQIQLFHSTLRGVYYSHLLAHTSSFSDLIEAGKKLDLGIKLGRMEGPTGKGEESSKNVPATSSSSNGRRGKEVSVNAINPAHQTSQQYSVNLTTTPTTAPAYFPPPPQHQPQSIYYSAPPVPPPMASQPYDHHYAFTSAPPPQPRISLNAASIIKAHQGILSIIVGDNKVPWTYEGGIGNVEQQFSVMGVTLSGRVYENPAIRDKGKAPATEVRAVPGSSPFPSKRVTEEEAEAFMKVIKASEYKVVEQMAKSPAHISLLTLLLSSEPHQEALLRVLTEAQVPKEMPPDRIEETVGCIFSNTISFSDDELPSEGWTHSRALHIMNVDLNRVRPSKTAVRAFDGSRREVNGEIDLLIDVGPCSFSITFQVLYIPNAFSLLLGRPWIHSADAVPSSLHQRLKFIVEEKLITVKGEEDYAIYKETALPYISVGDDENLSFHSFETGRCSCATTTSPAQASGCADKGSAALSKSRNTSIGGDSTFAPPAMKSLKPAGATISASSPHTTGGSTGAFQLHPNPNPRHFDSNPFKEHLGEPQPVYFGEGLPEDSQVLEIEESLRRLEDHQITSVEPPEEEINMGTEEEPRTVKFGTAVDPAQRTWMIDFLKEYQEVFAWSYADMSGLDPSIVEHFLPLDTEKFPPKRQQLRRQRASLLLRIKEEVVKQINVGFLEVCNYSE
ncbi:hypothetical protein CRG98_041064 [Punica granatum]|uniref:Retrotransposon gag domain-containing protein n=1 Tax=Punica granatum TaxID=22663 RepID=A0A2I0I3N3_PUNGR|nr:hypothetical protein CRG98_041064 [Punica granatum]